jgi:hypothetical protein
MHAQTGMLLIRGRRDDECCSLDRLNTVTSGSRCRDSRPDPSSASETTTLPAPLQSLPLLHLHHPHRPKQPQPLHITLICPCTLHACCLQHASVACALRRNCGPPPAPATITNSACRRPQHRTPAPCLSNSTPQSSVSSVSNARTHFCVPILSVAGPFQQEVSQTLRLKNPHSDPVAFKVSRCQHAAVLCRRKPLSWKLTTAGQNHRSQAVRTDPPALLPPCQLTNGFSDTAYDRTVDALSPGEMSKYRVRSSHALHCARMQAQINPLTRACSPSPGHEGGPTARCQVPRQVPRPVRPRHRRQGVHQRWISGVLLQLHKLTRLKLTQYSGHTSSRLPSRPFRRRRLEFSFCPPIPTPHPRGQTAPAATRCSRLPSRKLLLPPCVVLPTTLRVLFPA